MSGCSQWPHYTDEEMKAHRAQATSPGDEGRLLRIQNPCYFPLTTQHLALCPFPTIGLDASKERDDAANAMLPWQHISRMLIGSQPTDRPPPRPRMKDPSWTDTESRAMRVNGEAAALRLASIQPGAWLYLRKLFFIQSPGQWTMSCLFKARLASWSWLDTSLQFPYAHLNILPKLISLFLKPSIHVGQAASAWAVRSVHFSLYITQRNELLLWNH